MLVLCEFLRHSHVNYITTIRLCGFCHHVTDFSTLVGLIALKPEEAYFPRYETKPVTALSRVKADAPDLFDIVPLRQLNRIVC
jgi:hypothetical protein